MGGMEVAKPVVICASGDLLYDVPFREPGYPLAAISTAIRMVPDPDFWLLVDRIQPEHGDEGKAAARNPAIKKVIPKDREQVFQGFPNVEIVRRFESGEGFDGIPGLAFSRGNRLVRTEYAAAVDLDALPFPRRALTAQYRSRYYSEWMRPLASIRTSKGCPYSCTFCALWKLTGGRYLRRRPERVVQELADLDEEYVFFADDESLVDVARIQRRVTQHRTHGLRAQLRRRHLGKRTEEFPDRRASGGCDDDFVHALSRR